MKIGKILISNFRSIQETEFQLQDTVTALAGGNESGKSNALRSIKSFLDGSPFDESDQYQLSDLPPAIQIAFHTFSEDEKNRLKELLNIEDITELVIKRTAETYELISPLPVIEDIPTPSDQLEAETVADEVTEENTSASVEAVPSSEAEETLSIEEIVEAIREILPEVEYMRAINDLIIGKNLSITELYDPKTTKGQLITVRKFLELGAITESIVKTPDTDARTKHLNRGAARIGKKLRDSWNQEDVKLRIFADNESLVIHFRDGKNIADKHKDDDTRWIWTLPEDRSDGFRWYVTFYTRYIAKLKESKNIILLLDDAGGPLNIIAQKDLLKQISNLCADNNDLQVFYVTHSKDMLDWGDREKILLADKKRGNGTKVEKCWWEKYSKRNLPGPLNELGATWEQDFLSADNIIVEGYTDLLVLQRLQTVFKVVENFPQGVFIAHKIVVAGRASEMMPVAKLALATGKKAFLLPDSDQAGLQTKQNASQANIPCDDLQSLTEDQTIFSIEDLLPRKELLEALNVIGKKLFPDNWEDIRQLRNITTGVSDAIKARLTSMGVGDGTTIWRSMKLEVVNTAVDNISVASYSNEDQLKQSIIKLFTKLASLPSN